MVAAGTFRQVRRVLGACVLLGGMSAVPAMAEGFPPYFGFSGYYGAPTTYYTQDTDVHQSTRLEAGSSAFGTRTYTRGGPFWGYQPVQRRVGGHHHYRKARYVRVKG
jgi:hypothetical protein